MNKKWLSLIAILLLVTAMNKKWLSLIAILLLVTALAACKKEETVNNATTGTETTGTETMATDTNTTTGMAATDTSATGTSATGSMATNMDPADTDFVNKAAIGGMAEVQMGNMAATKAQSADVKAFGQRMVTDHSKANDELKALATQKGLTLPTDLDAEHKSAMDHLNGLTGKDFDKAYMDHMVNDHEKDVKEFEKASKDAKDADLKGWAGKTLPTLQDHLKNAKSVKGKVK